MEPPFSEIPTLSLPKGREPYRLKALPVNTSSLKPNLYDKKLRVNSVPLPRSGFRKAA
jgi:hypothetical protein